MDIYGAWVGHTTQEPMDPSLASSAAAPKSATQLWLKLALLIEETQWVTFFLNVECTFEMIPRIDIQQHLWHYGQDPHGDDRQKLDKMRASLAPLLVEVNWLQIVAGVYQCEAPQLPPPQSAELPLALPDTSYLAPLAVSHLAQLAPTNGEPMAQGHNAQPVDPLAHWDIIVHDVDEPNVVPVPETEKNKKKGLRMWSQAIEELVSMEQHILHIPSNQNVTPQHDDVELALRKNQARSHLHQLWELIAKKSVFWCTSQGPQERCQNVCQGNTQGDQHTNFLPLSGLQPLLDSLNSTQCWWTYPAKLSWIEEGAYQSKHCHPQTQYPWIYWA